MASNNGEGTPLEPGMQLAGKVCLIAGASGAIGSAITHRFRQEGAHLVLGSGRSNPDHLCAELGPGPGRVSCYPFDVADWEQVRDAVREIEAEFGRVDALVDCAGVIGPIGPLETLDMREWARAVEVNLIGSVHLARAVLPGMKQRRCGKIILLSGGGAAYARPFFTSYSSSKAALVRFTESLAHELKETNIQVNAIAPGPVKSRMWDEIRTAGPAGGPKLVEELKQMDESGGTAPTRAAELALFLASDRSNRLTGRLVSALWDDWDHLENHIDRIASSEAWTLRRVTLN